MRTAVLALMADPDWAVREQLAASLGELPAATKEAAMAAFLERHASDPVAMDAALSGLSGSEARGARDAAARDRGDAAARDGDHDAGGDDRVERAGRADSAACSTPSRRTTRPAWQRSALLRGAEVTLLGADAPGSARPRTRRRAGG